MQSLKFNWRTALEYALWSAAISGAYVLGNLDGYKDGKKEGEKAAQVRCDKPHPTAELLSTMKLTDGIWCQWAQVAPDKRIRKWYSVKSRF